MPSPRSKQFLLLQAEWDKKLKDSGFEDVEQRDGFLKEWSQIYSRSSAVSREAKQEYYRVAGHFLYSYPFTEFERILWSLHVEGVGIRDIVKIVKRTHGIRTYKNKVHTVLQRLAKEMIRNLGNQND